MSIYSMYEFSYIVFSRFCDDFFLRTYRNNIESEV
jgi:hypothetical protein